MTAEVFDFAIVGAGMAGASLAAELAPDAKVLILEAEDRPGYHATGRSVAFWEECYGGPDILPLTRASGPFLRKGGFLKKRGALFVGRASDSDKLDAFEARYAATSIDLKRLGADELASKVPGLRADWSDGIWQGECSDVDVTGLHSHYLTTAAKHGAILKTRRRVNRAEQKEGYWLLGVENGQEFAAKQLINAAGAWADGLAQLAGCAPLGIVPMRRTVAQIRTMPPPPSNLPLVLDISGTFYFKPDGGRLWLSPHDEVPTPPCDAAPEEIAVAQAIDRFEQVVDWSVESVETKWAGLRSFAPDRLPVFGQDPANPAFFWFAGQGGYGIQTAPAAASIAAQQLLGRAGSTDVTNVDANLYSPARFT